MISLKTTSVRPRELPDLCSTPWLLIHFSIRATVSQWSFSDFSQSGQLVAPNGDPRGKAEILQSVYSQI